MSRCRIRHLSPLLAVPVAVVFILLVYPPRVAYATDLAALSSGVSAQDGPAVDSSVLEGLWLDIGLGPPLVEWFNEVARPNDIARANSIEQFDLLDEVSTGRKLVVFKSVAAAEEALPQIADRIDIVGYNLEHGPANPPDEQADPVGSIRRLRSLADRYGLQVALGPDHDFAVSHGAAMAPYTDVFVLQIQRVQTDPDEVKDFVLPLAKQIRRANPDAELSVQVRTEGDVHAITELLAELESELAGISVLTSPETVDTAVELVSAIRPSQPVLALRPTEEPAEPSSRFRRGFVVGTVATLFGVGFVLFGIAAVLAAVTLAVYLLWKLVGSAERGGGA